MTDLMESLQRSSSPLAQMTVLSRRLMGVVGKTSEQTGGNFIAIPHNSNISKGSMFDTITMRNEPVGPAYAEIRKRWEPIVEITQYKGDLRLTQVCHRTIPSPISRTTRFTFRKVGPNTSRRRATLFAQHCCAVCSSSKKSGSTLISLASFLPMRTRVLLQRRKITSMGVCDR